MSEDTRESTEDQKTKPRGWAEGIQDFLKFGTSVAVLIYAVVYVVYWSFYTELGVSPEEVGASYASTLLHSIGYFAAFMFIFGLPYILFRNLRSHVAIPSALVIVAALSYTLLLFGFGLKIAEGQAADVQAGISIVPYRVGPIPILDVSASPVHVEWTNVATPSSKSLAAHKLFFLGANGGTSVFYDPTNAQAVRASSSSVLIVALNCELASRLPQSQQVLCLHDITDVPLNLSGADLSNADLRALNMQFYDFGRANLKGTNLSNSNLRGADLRQANLTGANVVRADLTEANLAQANLTGSDLREANLANANLASATASAETIWPVGFDPRSAGVKIAP